MANTAASNLLRLITCATLCLWVQAIRHLSLAGAPIPAPFQNISAGPWSDFKSLLDAKRGQTCDSLPQLKNYFKQFGYFSGAPDPQTGNFSKDFDNSTEEAIRLYQKFFHLNVTGVLDEATLEQIMKPRCSRKDISDSGSSSKTVKHFLHLKPRLGTMHYAFFSNDPKWVSTTNLTYAFSPYSSEKSSLSEDEVKSTIAAAFQSWATVVPLNFTEISDYNSANVRIAFISGNDSDGTSSDGKLGTLAHAYAPEDGRLHFDGAETWTINTNSKSASTAVDLQSVATHEIGHIIGLDHTTVQEAIMYPTISVKEVKVDLAQDDIDGAQTLYGANPNYNASSETKTRASTDSSGISIFHALPNPLFLLSALVLALPALVL